MTDKEKYKESRKLVPDTALLFYGKEKSLITYDADAEWVFCLFGVPYTIETDGGKIIEINNVLASMLMRELERMSIPVVLILDIVAPVKEEPFPVMKKEDLKELILKGGSSSN